MHLAKSLTRASAFTTRSIREESRLLTHHLLRGGIALSILIALFLQGVNSVFFGAAGLRLYSSICFLVYWFLTIAGTLYFSLAIAEEKDEGTLPLLQMTGVSDFALLLGKSIPRLAIVFLIQLVILPFSILSITLGGLTPGQLIASQICLLCYSFLLCEIGLLAGTVARSGTRA
ncbi:MAG: ABC transporter permease subunit, partial [Phycisphaerae bacterium]